MKVKSNKNPLFINKKVWSEFSDKEMTEYKNEVFDFFRKQGFPHFKLTDVKIDYIWNRLNSFNTDDIVKDNNILSQNMMGLNLVNYFMPHMWSTKCRGFKCPMDTFEDDVFFKKAIDKRISMGDNMSDAGMRKALSWSNGTHRVSNFRPTIAKYIYDNYAGDGMVMDFSCGYGGRLAGALSSDRVKSYNGFEPCIPTKYGLDKLYYSSGCNKSVSIYNSGSEVFNEELENCFDLSFSSPPYFNTEEYAYDENQSFVKFPNKESWVEGFLTKVIYNNFRYLKSGGVFAINVANVKSFKDLEDTVFRISEEMGFIHYKTYKMSLSSLMSSGYKYEPIFIFKKP